MTQVFVYEARKNAIFPKKATENSACFDLSACLNDGEKIQCYTKNNMRINSSVMNGRVVLYPDERMMLPTGLIFHIPEGYSIRVHPRSGNALKSGINMINCEGVIDSDYVEEIFLLLMNNSGEAFSIKHGDRLGQAELIKDEEISFLRIDFPPERKSSRDGGLGSTGK